MSTESILAQAGEIVAELVETREELGLDVALRAFRTQTHPDGFYVRVTSHMALWIVPMWETTSPSRTRA